ncbi:MAG: hypothetical protein KF851_02690 [Pirellulaceae bacterium]|nr:hypothetical protein [Pirellulaceae bacterium]
MNCSSLSLIGGILQFLIVVVVFACNSNSADALQIQQPQAKSGPSNLENLKSLDGSGVTPTISTAEWMGPLAPIALSPYFGITCLAGMSQFGNGTWLESNGLISHHPLLAHPALFWIFLALTLATSIPRFSKVSKPIAQLLDQIETYSALIIFVLLRLFVATAPEITNEVHLAGFGTVTWDLLLIVAAIVNVIVISTVRFVFEFVIWLSPIPLIDAAFELMNKGIVLALMAIYAFSPFVALILNLLLFVVCGLMFLPMYRRAIYMRALIVDPVLTIVFPRLARLQHGEMVVFNRQKLGSFPPKSQLYFSYANDCWYLRRPNWFIGSTLIEIPALGQQPQLICGGIVNKIILPDASQSELIFSRRYISNLPEISTTLNLPPTNPPSQSFAHAT